MPIRDTPFRAGEYYHVYNRGCNREPIFVRRENYLFFLTRLREYLCDSTADVFAYCLMPNHYHLLIRLRDDDLSGPMHAMSTSYSKAFNKECQRVGPLFQGPFRAIHVDREEYLLHLTRYIHLNPVVAGLVARPEDWEFSSYPEYVGLRNGTLPQPHGVLESIGSSEAYRAFVEAGGEGRQEPIMHLLIEE